MPALESPIAADPAVLARNISALAPSSPLAAEALLAAEPAADVEIVSADEPGERSGRHKGVWLASPRRPAAEARRLAEQVDPTAVGAALILGFGIGRHVRAVLDRCRGKTLVVVYEPDVTLLRAVFERVDCSSWMAGSGLVILIDAADDAAAAASLRGSEGMMALGVTVLEHPPSRARLESSAQRFVGTFSRVLAATRTTVVTTLVQAETTCRNFLTNARAYLEHPGIADLADLCAGRPAITVAAGPSLARALDRLRTPGLRERCVIIAAQTVLKPLLDAGITPHFVTSLDFHEISARFYEGLTGADVEGLTLVAEPKANPAILRAYPGATRLPREPALDLLLGDLAPDHGDIRAGATVAHLSYYLARHLGCDPVILVGQDLGFTDNLYYADGAAIHSVWAAELNPFRTLEMLEWERVARLRRQLRRIPAALGGEIYTDEQMATYLAQFNRVFLEDARRGLTTIDATEGGAAKACAEILPLADALDRHAPAGAPALPDLSPPPIDAARRDALLSAGSERIADVRRDLVTLATLSRDTAGLLDEMIEHADDPARLNRLITRAHRLRDRATALQPAFALTQRINQLGAFKRIRADRAINLTDALDPTEKQRRQIERDRVNVEWIADAADAMADILEESLAQFEPSAPPRRKRRSRPAGRAANTQSSGRPRRTTTGAVIAFDPGRTALGQPRNDAGATLARTVARLARCQRLGRCVVVTPDTARAEALLAGAPDRPELEFIEAPTGALSRPAVSIARAFSRTSWRGGIAGLAVFDECLAPEALARAMESAGLDAALIVGGDWPLVDPALCDSVIDRFGESADPSAIAFAQTPPGLAGCVVGRSLAQQMVDHRDHPAATVGGLLGYHPSRPAADPIGLGACVRVDPAVRDAAGRFIADDPEGLRTLDALGDRVREASAAEIVAAWRDAIARDPAPAWHWTIELAAGRPPHGVTPGFAPRGDAPHTLMPRDTAESILRAIAQRRPDAAITFAGAGDPLTHPDLPDLLGLAREVGLAAVHVRTPLAADDRAIDALAHAAPGVISVDLYANTADTYRAITGVDGFRRALEAIDHLRGESDEGPTIRTPWIVPRITRCAATRDEIEVFYDKWLLVTGAACIDPLPAGVTDGRFAALTTPAPARAAAARAQRFISVSARPDDLM